VTTRYDTWFHAGHTRETDRHGNIAEVFDPASTAVLDSLGIEPHWRCLDVGSGRGTIAAWLDGQAHRGSTVACDLDPDLPGPEPSPTLTWRTLDITTADFAPGSFDLVHARLLLQHLAGRERVLDAMVRWLAPGGWLVVADGFDLAAGSPAHPRYGSFYETLYRELPRHVDIDPLLGRRYPAPLVERGLTDVGLEIVAPPVRGGGPFARLLHESLDRIRPLVRACGIAESELDSVLGDLCDPSFWDLGYGLAIAWGRKPPA
jgi:SAM-dependent methyltransferase